MSGYCLNKKTYRERQKSNPEFGQVHDRLTSRIVYFLQRGGCSVHVADDSEQKIGKFDFATKIKDEANWTTWDVKVAATLPKQFCGVQTEFNCILNLLMWQGLRRFNNNNHIFWLLAKTQTRKNLTRAECNAAAKTIAERIISGRTLKNIRYCTLGANLEDRMRYWRRLGKHKMPQALLVTKRPLIAQTAKLGHLENKELRAAEKRGFVSPQQILEQILGSRRERLLQMWEHGEENRNVEKTLQLASGTARTFKMAIVGIEVVSTIRLRYICKQLGAPSNITKNAVHKIKGVVANIKKHQNLRQLNYTEIATIALWLACKRAAYPIDGREIDAVAKNRFRSTYHLLYVYTKIAKIPDTKPNYLKYLHNFVHRLKPLSPTPQYLEQVESAACLMLTALLKKVSTKKELVSIRPSQLYASILSLADKKCGGQMMGHKKGLTRKNPIARTLRAGTSLFYTMKKLELQHLKTQTETRSTDLSNTIVQTENAEPNNNIC